MKKKENKKLALLKKANKYLFDFIVVFAGVFLAFWLSEQKDKKNEAEKKREIYTAIYEDLNSFYEYGRRENEKGFINLFEDMDAKSDSLISIKKLSVKTNIYGDYWKIEIINSLIQGGFLKDIDMETFKKVTRFNTVHKNFLETIKEYNTFYDTYVTANYEMGMEYFYIPNTNELKPKFSYLNDALAEIADFAELLVNISHDISVEIKKKYIGKAK